MPTDIDPRTGRGAAPLFGFGPATQLAERHFGSRAITSRGNLAVVSVLVGLIGLAPGQPIRQALRIRLLLLLMAWVGAAIAATVQPVSAATFTVSSFPDNFTAVLSDGSGNTITLTLEPQNTACASVDGAGGVTLFARSAQSACDRTIVMNFQTNGFLLGRMNFNDIDDMDGTAPKDSFAANVAGTWTSPKIEIVSQTGKLPPSLSASTANCSCLVSAGGVGTLLANESGNNPTNERATFALSSSATNFKILFDEVDGARLLQVFFNLGPIRVDIAATLTGKAVTNDGTGTAVAADRTLTATGPSTFGSARAVTSVTVAAHDLRVVRDRALEFHGVSELEICGCDSRRVTSSSRMQRKRVWNESLGEGVLFAV